MSNDEVFMKKNDFQRLTELIKEIQNKILSDEEAAKLRDALNLTLLQMQAYWKIMKKKKKSHTKFSLQQCSIREHNQSPDIATRLYEACSDKEKVPKLFVLLSSGNSEDASYIFESEGYKGEVDPLGQNPLHYCSKHKNLHQLTTYFIQHGCDINHQSLDGRTPLHSAVANECVEVLKDLLKCNADTTVRDGEGRTPGHLSVLCQNTEILDCLIKHGSNLTTPDNDDDTPIMWSAINGRTDALRVLLSSPLGPKLAATRDKAGSTLLMLAVNHISTVEVLLNADTIRETNKKGQNILHYAAQRGRLDICKKCRDICKISEIFTRDADKRTPLHLAIEWGHGSIANFLLEECSDVADLRDNMGLAAIDIAIRRELHYCAMVLSAYVNDVAALNKTQGLASSPRTATSPLRPVQQGGRPQSRQNDISSYDPTHTPVIGHKLSNGPEPRRKSLGKIRKPDITPPPKMSHDLQPNDRRIILRNSSISGRALTQSTPSLKFHQSITPGLLQPNNYQLQMVSKKASALKEINPLNGNTEPRLTKSLDLREIQSLNGRMDIRPPSRKKTTSRAPPRNNFHVPVNTATPTTATATEALLDPPMSVSPPISTPWKPSTLQPLVPAHPPPPTSASTDPKLNGYSSNNDTDSYGSSSDTVVEHPMVEGRLGEGRLGEGKEEEGQEKVLIKEEVIAIRPKTARGYHVDKLQERYDRYSNSKTRDITSETNFKFQKTPKVDKAPLLGPIPSLPGQKPVQVSDPSKQPWYREKLKPVSHNKMDVLLPDEPP